MSAARVAEPLPKPDLPVRTRLLHVLTVPDSLVFLRGQLRFMEERGFSIGVATSPDARLDSFGAREGVSTWGVAMPRRITPFADFRAVRELARVIRGFRPAIVHAHTPKGGLLGMIAATLCGVPVRIYHMRGLPLVTATGLRRALLWSAERVTCALAHDVLCVSASLREEAIGLRLVPARKIRTLADGSGNGVDAVSRFNPDLLPPDSAAQIRAANDIPRDAFVVGYVGRLVRDKGIVELHDAWMRIRANPAMHLLLVGPFEPRDPVPASVRRDLESDERVHLVGSQWDVRPYYAAMDVLALPTHREGFPNVLLEAAAMGLPVVASAATGCVDAVVDGVTGTLVPVGDSGALSIALSDYATRADMRRQHGRAGRERALAHYRPELIWAALVSCYDRATGRAMPTVMMSGFPQ